MNNKKKIILGSIIGVLIGTLISVSYAFFTFSKTSNNNSQLVVGDIYMKYTGNNELDFEGAMPSSTYTAGKYFEFEVSGKNTTTNKDIIYDIVINHGVDNPKSRTTRIEDKFLKFRLVEVVEENNVRQEVTPDLIEGKSYNEINNTRIYVRTIPKNTTTEIKHIYRLYAWIDQSVVISNSGGDYTPAEWANLYASIRVDVTGDFTEKEVDVEENIETKYSFWDPVKLNSAIQPEVRLYDDLDAVKNASSFSNFWFKHIVKNGIVKETYLEFDVSEQIKQRNSGINLGLYSLKVGDSGLSYEENKRTLLEAFDTEKCIDYSDYFRCEVSELIVEIKDNGYIYIDNDDHNDGDDYLWCSIGYYDGGEHDKAFCDTDQSQG